MAEAARRAIEERIVMIDRICVVIVVVNYRQMLLFKVTKRLYLGKSGRGKRDGQIYNHSNPPSEGSKDLPLQTKIRKLRLVPISLSTAAAATHVSACLVNTPSHIILQPNTNQSSQKNH